VPTLRQLVDAGMVATRERIVSVTTAAGGTEILKPDPSRVAFTIVNDGAAGNFMRVTRREVPTTSRGLPVDSAGGVLAEDFDVFGRSVGDGRRAIMATGVIDVYVEETLVVGKVDG